MLLFDEAAVHLPDLVRLDHAHRFAPVIEAVWREPHVLGFRQNVLHPIERDAQKLDHCVVGFGKAVVGDQQGADMRRARRSPPSSTSPTRRNTPGPLANQPMVSNDGAISMQPLVSTRPWVVRMP